MCAGDIRIKDLYLLLQNEAFTVIRKGRGAAFLDRIRAVREAELFAFGTQLEDARLLVQLCERSGGHECTYDYI
jgi:hypothetical protein